jgi:hypothetical protein
MRQRGGGGGGKCAPTVRPLSPVAAAGHRAQVSSARGLGPHLEVVVVVDGGGDGGVVALELLGVHHAVLLAAVEVVQELTEHLSLGLLARDHLAAHTEEGKAMRAVTGAARQRGVPVHSKGRGGGVRCALGRLQPSVCTRIQQRRTSGCLDASYEAVMSARSTTPLSSLSICLKACREQAAAAATATGAGSTSDHKGSGPARQLPRVDAACRAQAQLCTACRHAPGSPGPCGGRSARHARQ